MAEEKKAKIDLKTRLKKMGAAGGQLETPGSSPPIPVPGRSGPGLTPVPPPAIPVPPGVPSPFGSQPAPRIDPDNPLAALAVPFRTGAPPAPPSQPQQPHRIEVDEAAVHHARSSTRNRMLVLGGMAAIGCGLAGFFGGKTSGESSAVESARTLAASNTRDIVVKLKKLRGEIDSLYQAVKAGRASLFPDANSDQKRAFPADLAQKMAGVKFSVDASDITDKRFIGKPETIRELYDFIATLQSVSERQQLIQSLLNSLKPAFEEELKGTDSYKVAILFQPTEKGQAKDYSIYKLKEPYPPFPATKEKPLPDKIAFSDAEVPRYTGGDVKDRYALPINPASMRPLCVPLDQSKKDRLSTEMNRFLQDISKEADPDNPQQDTKEGLMKREQNLENELSKSAG